MSKLTRLVCVVVLLSLIFNYSESWKWNTDYVPWSKRSMWLSNAIVDELLDYHCQSKDDDFGLQTLKYNQSQTYSFHIFDTFIKCNIWWGDSRGTGYGEGLEMYNYGECGQNLEWAFETDGIYPFDSLIKIWKLVYTWDPPNTG